MNVPRILVLGVGNLLLSDEGVGVQFLRELALTALPSNVELIDAGTAGWELVHLIDDFDFVIVVDAIDAITEPGTIFLFSPADLRSMPAECEVSLHQAGLIAILNTARYLRPAPDILIFGIQPAKVEWGLDLSSAVKNAFPTLQRLIFEQISYVNKYRQFKPGNSLNSRGENATMKLPGQKYSRKDQSSESEWSFPVLAKAVEAQAKLCYDKTID